MLPFTPLWQSEKSKSSTLKKRSIMQNQNIATFASKNHISRRAQLKKGLAFFLAAMAFCLFPLAGSGQYSVFQKTVEHAALMLDAAVSAEGGMLQLLDLSGKMLYNTQIGSLPSRLVLTSCHIHRAAMW